MPCTKNNRNSLLVSNSVTTVGNWETFEGALTSLISPDFHSGEFRRLVPMMNPHRHLPRRRGSRSMKCLRPLLHIHCSNSKKSKELKEKPSIPTQKTPLAALLFYSGADVTDLDSEHPTEGYIQSVISKHRQPHNNMGSPHIRRRIKRKAIIKTWKILIIGSAVNTNKHICIQIHT